MANYCSVTRTNYFRVKDPDEFRAFMQTVYASEGTIDVWEESCADGVLRFGFGCYSSILGVGVGDTDEYGLYWDYDYEEFATRLSELVAEDDAIIILESGNEKLRYVVGTATVITSTGTEFLDVSVMAAQSAAKLLNNPEWKTQISY